MIEMRLDINIIGLEGLATSILALAHGMSGNAMTEKQRAVSPAEVTAPAQAPVQNTTPSQPVSTSVATYKLDDIANAAMALMDSGRQPELVQLLAGFGVEALPALPQERYAEFATALRGLGARI